MNGIKLFLFGLVATLVSCSTIPETSEKFSTIEKVDSSRVEEIEDISSSRVKGNSYQDSVVSRFIQLVRERNASVIAENTDFPIRRDYPVADVKDSTEFVERFDELFDDTLTNRIIESDLQKDWDVVGSLENIGFNAGDVWLNYKGNLIAVNYQNKLEDTIRENLILADLDTLNESIHGFVKPIVLFFTKTYQIRIDELEDYQYRYACWRRDSSQLSKPELVLTGGDYVWDGSAGNHHYEFKNYDYTYQCFITVLGKEDYDTADLVILKKGKEILRQESADVRYR